MNAREASQLARQALRREDPQPELDDLLLTIAETAGWGETRLRIRVPERKRLVLIEALRNRGFDTWMSAHDAAQRWAYLTIIWPLEEEP